MARDPSSELRHLLHAIHELMGHDGRNILTRVNKQHGHKKRQSLDSDVPSNAGEVFDSISCRSQRLEDKGGSKAIFATAFTFPAIAIDLSELGSQRGEGTPLMGQLEVNVFKPQFGMAMTFLTGQPGYANSCLRSNRKGKDVRIRI